MIVDTSSATALTVTRLTKTFSGKSEPIIALRDVSFAVNEGEFFSIVGPSGCGKSTLLNILAGLDFQDSGEIALNAVGEVPAPVVSGVEGPSRVPPETTGGHRVRPDREGDRHPTRSRLGRSAYMPQKDLLLPWRTVLENAALGLELTGVPTRGARKRAADLLNRFGLDDFANSYPALLSGGMRQRAAFLRTVLTDKNLLLLDEPFGALDALTRRSMQEWLLGVWSELRRTVVLITHDVEEAILLSDRVAVMSPRPGSIILERTVDLPRPRYQDMVIAPEFVEIKRDVLVALREGIEGRRDAPE